MVPAVGMLFRILRYLLFRIFEVDPLYVLRLGAHVHGLVLRRVRDAEHVADIVGAVDLVQSREGLGAPDVDDRLAGAREQVVRVGGQEEAEHAALVSLDALDHLEGAERPDDDLALVRAGEDVAVAYGEGEDGAVVLQLVDLVRR